MQDLCGLWSICMPGGGRHDGVFLGTSLGSGRFQLSRRSVRNASCESGCIVLGTAMESRRFAVCLGGIVDRRLRATTWLTVGQ